MSKFSELYPNGVTEYVHGILQWSVSFPAKYVCCEMCNFIMYERNNGCYCCGVTKEKIIDKTKGVCVGCPLEFFNTDRIMEE